MLQTEADVEKDYDEDDENHEKKRCDNCYKQNRIRNNQMSFLLKKTYEGVQF